MRRQAPSGHLAPHGMSLLCRKAIPLIGRIRMPKSSLSSINLMRPVMQTRKQYRKKHINHDGYYEEMNRKTAGPEPDLCPAAALTGCTPVCQGLNCYFVEKAAAACAASALKSSCSVLHLKNKYYWLFAKRLLLINRCCLQLPDQSTFAALQPVLGRLSLRQSVHRQYCRSCQLHML